MGGREVVALVSGGKDSVYSMMEAVRHGFVYQGEVTHADLPHYWYVRA
jgi:diphthamide synthase (EF-2-diphthine--ammonia ligase)